MASNPVYTKITRYWGIIVLLLWGACLLGFNLLRFGPYGLDEGATRALLLNWSIADNMLNPVITLGVPDFRALLLIPPGIYFSGNLIAAKVFTIILAFLAVTMLYRWCVKFADNETAMIGCGLLLVFPLFINQIDSISAGTFLILAFTLGSWIDSRVRKINRVLGGWFFIQLFWVCLTVTIHPIGLAYPLALAWRWHKDPVDQRQKKHLFIGLTVVVLTTLAMRSGWQTASWLDNPFEVLAVSYHAITNVTGEFNWFVATMLTVFTLLVAWVDRQFLLSNLLGLMLLSGIVIGLPAADSSWALLVITLIFTRGTYQLIRLNQSFGGSGLLRNRGIVLSLLFALSTSSMIADKARRQAIAVETLSMQDELIQILALEAADPDTPFQAASQWPGRTMIAAKRDTFPLPRSAGESSEDFLQSINGITHLMFNPYDPANKPLSDRMAELAGVTKTLELNPAGVIVKLSTDNPDASITNEAHHQDSLLPKTVPGGELTTPSADMRQ